VTQSNQMASPISRFCTDLWLWSGCEDDILPSWNLASIQAKDISRHHGLRHPRRWTASFRTPDPDSGQGEVIGCIRLDARANFFSSRTKAAGEQ
jgi:hypothetical protein